MSEALPGVSSTERLMTFEVSGTTYALPVAGILEVIEQATVSCVPALGPALGGVMNWHGEALPVVASHLLLRNESGDGSENGLTDQSVTTHEPGEARQFLVVSDRLDGFAKLGLPIDFVTGLVSGEPGRACGDEVVVERRPVDGRVVSVIDPQRLVARAAEVIESAVA